MKKGKFISALLVFVLLVASLSVLLVACKPEEKPEEQPEFTVSDAIGELANSFRNTYIHNGKAFGWDMDLSVNNFAISTQGRIDPNDAAKTKFDFDFAKDGNSVVRFSADETYLYMVAGDAKKRLKDFQLYNVVKQKSMPDSNTTEDIAGYLELGLNALFSSEDVTFTKVVTTFGKTKYELNGNLKTVVDMVKGALTGTNIPGLDSILDKLSSQKITLKAVVSADGKMENFNFDLASINAKVTKLEFSKDCDPEINLPDARDAFDTTNALNFTFEGRAALRRQDPKNNRKSQEVYAIDYEIRADINIFKALREGFDSNMNFNPAAIFADPTNKLYIDLSHECGPDCKGVFDGKSFCEKYRLGTSKGSILTIAYDPASFGNNNINVAANINAILPKGFIKELVGMDIDLIVKQILPNYFGIALDPVALFTNNVVEDNVAQTSAVSDYARTSNIASVIDVLLNNNIVAIARDVLGFLGSFEPGKGSLELGTQEFIKFIDAIAGTSVGDKVVKFFEGTDSLYIGVNNAKYADPTTQDVNSYNRFINVNKNKAEYGVKKFEMVSGKSIDLTPVGKLDFEKDKNGQVKITADGVENYDKEGNSLNISILEAQQLFSNGKVNYTGTNLYGANVKGTVNVLSVYGLDYNKLDVEQNVTVVASLPDGGWISEFKKSSLGSMISKFVDLSILDRIPGSHFNLKITLSKVDVVGNFYQAEDNADKFVADKTYYYRDNTTKLDPTFLANVKYTDGREKVVQVRPDNYANLFYKDNTINFLTNTKLVYSLLGHTETINVNVGKHIGKFEKVNVNYGESYTTGNTFKVYKDTDKQQVTNDYTLLPGVNKFEYKLVDGDANGIKYTHISATDSTCEYARFDFTKRGKYLVEIATGQGFTQSYEFNVIDKQVTPVMPTYNMDAVVNDKVIVLTFTKTGSADLGDLKANISVKKDKADANALVRGTDYVVKQIINGKDEAVEGAFMLQKTNLSKVVIKIEAVKEGLTFSEKSFVTAIAVDYKDAVIKEKNPELPFSAYSLTGELINDKTYKNYIKVKPVVPDYLKIADLKIKVEVKAKLQGENDFKVLELGKDYNLGAYYDIMEGWGMFAPLPVPEMELQFTSNGRADITIDGKLKKDLEQVIVFTDGSPYKANPFIYEVNVYAENHNNKLIASMTNA